MSENVNMTQLNCGTEDLKSLWLNFTDLLIPEQADEVNRAYDLISLTLNENALSAIIGTILVDETMDTNNQINSVKKILIDSMMQLLNDMGIIINPDFVGLEEITDLCDILDVLYSTDEIEDVLGLIYILDNETYDNKEKLIQVILRFLQKESYETDAFDYIIEEVSSDVIKGLYIGLGVYTIDDGDYINPDVMKRVKANKAFLEGTLAYKHIVNGGGTGLSYQVYCKLFVNELAAYAAEGAKQYMKEIMGICLMSSLTNAEIEEGFEELVREDVNSMEDIYAATSILEKVKL